MHDGAGTDAADLRFSRMYTELHALAERAFRGQQKHHTLQPTALINEAWMKLRGRPGFESRAHVLFTAAKAMRHVLVDHARRRETEKRGAGLERVTLHEGDAPVGEAAEALDVRDLDAALARLVRIEPRQAQVVELKFFGGCTIPEIAESLGVSHMTVSSDWRRARVWLAGALGDERRD